jgi:pimeloyl-ACP methyl ester carboxylesterase
VSFPTADFVTLHGQLYPGARGKKGACVLLVHDLGRGHRGDDLAPLALALQGAGHTVMQLDLRGHGASTHIDNGFWAVPANQLLPGFATGKNGGVAAAPLDPRTLPAQYFPWLVQDLAAARLWLDVHNDDADEPVNSANLVVVGAGEGAALAALWLAAESRRFAAKVGDLGPFPQVDGNPEVQYVAAGVWLTMVPRLGGRTAAVQDWLALSGRDRKVPMGFLYGADDVSGARLAERLANGLKPNPRPRELTAARAVPGTSLTGARLLQSGLETDKLVLAYVDNVLQQRDIKWSARTVQANVYYWVVPGAQPLAANLLGGRIPVERLGVKLP